MSIRKVFTILSIAFLLVAFLTAGALVHSTSQMHELARSAQKYMKGVIAAEELQVSLLRSREFERGLSPQVAEATIRSQLREVEAFAESPNEQSLLDRIEANVNVYLQMRSDVLLSSKPRGPIPNAFFEQTLALAKEFANINIRQAEAIELEILAADRGANIAAGALSFACILIFFTVLFLIRRSVVGPISNLGAELNAMTARNELADLSTGGPRELASIAAAFNELASQVRNQKETGLRFLAGVAHDLRNPLGAIRMSSEILKDDSASLEERQAVVQIIARQAAQLDRMVGDLLDTTRVESGQLEMKKQAVDLCAVVEDAVRLHRAVSHIHDISFVAPNDDVILEADPLRLSQVLNNFLNNAIKYSPNGGAITVSIEASKDLTRISLRDSGIGISKDDQKTMFEPFRRTKMTKNTIPGVGLGLSVSKKIVEAHGGRIEVESVLGSGTTFSIILPAPIANHDAGLPRFSTRAEMSEDQSI